MIPLTKEKLEEILNSGDFNQLIGYYENDWFDCKKEFYVFDNLKGKRELAKDISSFANVDGGYILIGLKGKEDASHSGEQINEISLYEENQINIEQHRKIIEEWIYPKIEEISIKWLPTKEDETKGLVLIKIPPQKESLKPFLIKNALIDDKTTEIMFGLAQRRGDKSSHYELRDLHRLIQQGQQYEKNLYSRLDAIEQSIKGLSVTSSEKDFDKKKLEERIEGVLIKTNQIEQRNLVLTACVDGNYRIKNFNSLNEIKNLPKKYTQPIRDGGWKLLYSANLITDSIDLIEVGYDSNSLTLYEDGTAIYIRNLNQVSLAENPSQLIPIALVEVIYHFADFYRQFVDYIEEDFINVLISVELNNLKKNDFPTLLTSDLKPGHYYEPYYAPENSFKGQIDITKDFNPKVLAFQILKLVYEWFHIDLNPPFTKEETGILMVDVDKIANP